MQAKAGRWRLTGLWATPVQSQAGGLTGGAAGPGARAAGPGAAGPGADGAGACTWC